MEFESNDKQPDYPPPPEPASPGSVPRPQQARTSVSATGWNSPYTPVPPNYGSRHSGWRVLSTIFFIFSILANIALFMLVIFLIFIVFSTNRHKGVYQEGLVKQGPRAAKIAIIDVEGVIMNTQSKRVYEQLGMARRDHAVKGLILRISSPGGTISASDQIYNEIRKFRQETGKPVVAFMQGIATSGGYYISVACEQIMAEPTTITGSIGVIMQYFVMEQLLEDKLGVLPVVIKAGQKKDWPSSYHAPTDEQLAYLEENVIKPAYDRFVEVVAQGREDILTQSDVERLADGGVLTAIQARSEHLIDRIGYFDDAVELIKDKAGLPEARVVEYQDTFSFSSLLRTQSNLGWTLDREKLREMSAPEFLYLWSGY